MASFRSQAGSENHQNPGKLCVEGWTYPDNDHRQGVYIRLVCRLYRFRPYDHSRAEEFWSAVTNRSTVVGGRGIDRVDTLRYRTETKTAEAGIALHVNEDIWLGKLLC